MKDKFEEAIKKSFAKKNKEWQKGFIAGIISILCGVLLTLLFHSCQTKTDPLDKAAFPCECIYKSKTNYAVKFKCQDGEYYFVDKEHNQACKEGDIINEPLNSKP